MDDKEKLKETEAQIIENTLRWIAWTINTTRKSSQQTYFNYAKAYSYFSFIKFMMTGPDSKKEHAKQMAREPFKGTRNDYEYVIRDYERHWTDAMTLYKTSFAFGVFSLEHTNQIIFLYDEILHNLGEVQKILFSRRNQKLEEAVKYIEQLYSENDDSFEKRIDCISITDNRYTMPVENEVSPKKVINTAFRMLALKLHPDKKLEEKDAKFDLNRFIKQYGGAERFKILKEMCNHLLHTDLEDETDSLSILDSSNRHNHAFKVLIEQDFQVVRKLLLGKPIPKNWKFSEEQIKRMADDGVDTSPFL